MGAAARRRRRERGGSGREGEGEVSLAVLACIASPNVTGRAWSARGSGVPIQSAARHGRRGKGWVAGQNTNVIRVKIKLCSAACDKGREASRGGPPAKPARQAGASERRRAIQQRDACEPTLAAHRDQGEAGTGGGSGWAWRRGGREGWVGGWMEAKKGSGGGMVWSAVEAGTAMVVQQLTAGAATWAGRRNPDGAGGGRVRAGGRGRGTHGAPWTGATRPKRGRNKLAKLMKRAWEIRQTGCSSAREVNSQRQGCGLLRCRRTTAAVRPWERPAPGHDPRPQVAGRASRLQARPSPSALLAGPAGRQRPRPTAPASACGF